MPRVAERHGQAQDQTLGYLLAGPANKYWLARINVLFPLLLLMMCLVLQLFVMGQGVPHDLSLHYDMAWVCVCVCVERVILSYWF